MNLHRSLSEYLRGIRNTQFPTELGERGGYITFSNSGKRGEVKSFTIALTALKSAFEDIRDNINVFVPHQYYVEGDWRDHSEHFTDLTIRSNITVQTKPLFVTLSKLVSWANDMPIDTYQDGTIKITQDSITQTLEKLSRLISSYPAPKDDPDQQQLVSSEFIFLPKPFLLLAGISGTGKTRFVRQQAAAHRGGDLTNHCLVPVRPDWHEPSDLLGYISRIGKDGPRYVVTDLLRFVVKAWKDVAATATAAAIEYKPNEQMTPHWLCLDEMNLAPVEQYFADYLSVLETRKWNDGKYSCDPLFKPDTMRQLDADGLSDLRGQLGLGAEHDGLWQYFVARGIPLPPNLIVAGTVNMDETTHGFSRKVIDRAFTIDFGVFYPNNFSEFFDPKTRPKTLGFPVLSHITADDLAGVAADAGGEKSIAFLVAINGVLKDSPFELAYRALNELLLAVVCFQPKDEAELRAVWDDFLMTKVLPRIDGDAEKLIADGDASLLTRLLGAIDEQFKFDEAAGQRPDLLRENRDGSSCTVNYRAKQKLDWMQKRLDANGFTTFWP